MSEAAPDRMGKVFSHLTNAEINALDNPVLNGIKAGFKYCMDISKMFAVPRCSLLGSEKLVWAVLAMRGY